MSEGQRPAVDEAFGELDDVELIAATRDGDTGAYGELYARHAGPVSQYAHRHAKQAVDAQDAVAEAFTGTLRSLRAGFGPRDGIRAYLTTSVRNALIRTHHKTAPTVPVADLADLPHDAADSTEETVFAAAEADLAMKAFRSLDDATQWVLWLTTVEGMSVAEVADELELSPGVVAARAYRAREKLRQAYLAQHLRPADQVAGECRRTLAHLSAYVRGKAPAGKARQVSAHVAVCAACADQCAELSRVNATVGASLTLGAGKVVGGPSGLAGTPCAD